MAKGNGGIIGPVNTISAGGNNITTFNCTGTITTQSGTTLIHTLVVAGGGGGAAGAGSPIANGGAGGSGVVIIRYKYK